MPATLMPDDASNVPFGLGKPGRREISVFLVLDPEQVKLLSPPKPPQRNRLSIEDALRILQMIAILTAALWTWNEYRQFKQESQKLALDRDRLDVAQRQLTIDLASLDTRLKRTEVDASEQTPIGFDIETNVQKVQTGIQRAEVKMRVRNNSKNPINVRTAVIELFVGSLSAESTPSQALQLNGPTDDPGPIKWVKVLSRTYLANDLTGALLGAAPSSFSFGSPAFGTLIANDDSNFVSHEYRLAAKQDQWVGFVETFAIEAENKKPRDYILFQWRAVADVGWQDALGRSADDDRPDRK